MKLLLHICCAPCTIYPLSVLKSEGHEVNGLFYNPNIHPYLEYKKRLETLKIYAGQEKLSFSFSEEYPMELFFRKVVSRETERCWYCYYERLTKTARIAKSEKQDGFTTTLLYSKYQRHDDIKTIGEELTHTYGIPFLYRDFRKGWKEGVQESKRINMYRQQYCGCIFSEKDRYGGG